MKGPLGGQTIRLEPWQCFILVNVWGWLHTTGPLKDKRRYRKAYISVGRGNAKSTLSSALALYMLCADKEPGAEIYSAATTRDQAKIVFGDAQTMARKDKAMQKYFGLTVQQHVMTVNSTGSVFRPLATEGNVNDGLNRHSPDSRPFQGQDRASDRLEQRQIAVAASKGPSKLMVDGGPTLKRRFPCTRADLSPHCLALALVARLF